MDRIIPLLGVEGVGVETSSKAFILQHEIRII